MVRRRQSRYKHKGGGMFDYLSNWWSGTQKNTETAINSLSTGVNNMVSSVLPTNSSAPAPAPAPTPATPPAPAPTPAPAISSMQTSVPTPIQTQTAGRHKKKKLHTRRIKKHFKQRYRKV